MGKKEVPIIEYKGKRYKMLTEGRVCTKSCSFARTDGKDMDGSPLRCERKCYLPKWFQKLGIDGWLVQEGE